MKLNQTVTNSTARRSADSLVRQSPRPLVARTRLSALRQKRRRHGFTLVELLLVLVILGILAAIVVPKFSGHSERAREQAARTQIESFRTMLNNYEVDVGRFPNSLNDLIVQPRDAQNWHGPYMQADSIPKDPWGNDYVYRAPGAHNPSFFDLSSAGPAGGDVLIANWTVKK